MKISAKEVKTTAGLLVGIGALAGAPAVGPAKLGVAVGSSLWDLYSGRRADPSWEDKVAEALNAKLVDPTFHRPAGADRLLPQMVEHGLPLADDLTGRGWRADAVALRMRDRVVAVSTDPAHQTPAILDAFTLWMTAGLSPLLDSGDFAHAHAGAIAREMFERFDRVEAKQDTANEKLDEILRRLGGAGAVLADPEALSLDELQALAANFGEAAGRSKGELVDLIKGKAQEHAAFVAEIEAINERTAGLGNLKAAAKAAAEKLDYAEVEHLLSKVSETEIEIAAETLELRADNALLRNRPEEAYRLLSAAADSFAVVDEVEPARRAVNAYGERLYRHGLRYGGAGLSRATDFWGRFITDGLFESDPDLWAAGQNNLGLAIGDQGARTGGEAGATLLAEAVAAYRAAQRVWTETEHPVDWAMTQNNLGLALRVQGARLGGEDGAALLAETVAAYRAAQRVYTEAEHPVDWAATQVNLGNALSDQGARLGGEAGAALLAEAVAAYCAAQRVYTEAEHPVDWAETMENIAIAEENLADHETRANSVAHLRAGLEAVTAAMRVFEPEHMRNNFDRAARLKTRLEARLREGD